VVELYLALLEFALARLQTDLVQGLNGIGGVGLNIYGGVHYAVGSDSKDTG